MRIAQVATLCTPVRRDHCGSVESLVWLLSRELIRLGHEVTTFAAAGSETEGALVATLPGPYGQAGSPGDWQTCEWVNLCRAIEQSDRFDVMHSHGYLLGLPLEPMSKSPMVHTYHVQPATDQADLWRLAKSPCVTALSSVQWNAFPDLKPAAVIHHGVDPDQFTFQPVPGDYFCYLGRFMPEKGPLAAIEAAKAVGVKLMLAGPRNPYYNQHIEPLVDGLTVLYVGYMSGRERDQLLGNARALLYPLQSAEPFGLVIPEALMCGTPVVTNRLGAVAELVDDGVTGCIAASPADFVQQIRRSFTLDRHQIRKTAEARFTARRMAEQYAALYEQVLKHTSPRSEPHS